MSHVTHRKYGTYLERDTSLDGNMTPLYVHITKRATREVQTAFGDWRRSPTPVAQDPRTLLLCYCPSKSMALSEVLTDNKAQLLSDDNLYNVIDRCSNSSIVASKDCPSVCVPSQAAQLNPSAAPPCTMPLHAPVLCHCMLQHHSTPSQV
jgi:hypothetical protein